MEPSSWIAFGAALAFGAVFGWIAYLIAPHWIVLTIVTLLVGGIAYRTSLEMMAHEKIIDRGDWPNQWE
jgi:hypothetical protein